MKQFMLVSGLALSLGLSAQAASAKPAEKPAPADFTVAVSGKDGNPGTAKAPFATLAKAREAVREKIKEGLAKDLVVEIRGGTYPVTETLTFGPEDSGTEKFSITYAAAPGEKVVLSGGRKITGWRKGTNEIWTAEIPEAKEGKWYFRQLFVNGQRAIRARTPNADDKMPWWKIKTTVITPGATNQNSQLITMSVDHPIQAWKNSTDVELIYLNNNDASRKRVGAVNEAAQTFTLPPPHQWPPSISAQTGSHPAPGIACYLENAPEMLDQPGEWYLDRTSGVLAYWPRPGENVNEAEVIAPVVQNTLLAVTGVVEKPVLNLHFEGIQVEHVDWPLPSYGFALMFGCLQVTTEQPKFYWIDAAVSFKHARACNFTDGGVAHSGGIGLALLSGCAQNVIEGNQLYDLGGGGIVAGGIHPRDGLWKWADPIALDDHLGYRIANNAIHHCGTDYFGAIGIFLGLTQEAVVAHNLIHDIAYCGIVLSGNSTPLKLARNNTVEYNHIHDVLQTAVDGGGIYLSFPHEGWGAVIRGNFVHDIGYSRDGTANGNADQGLKRWGLALDDVTPELRLKNYQFVSNVICDVSGGAVTAVYEPHKTNLTWIGNTFTDGSVPRELFDAMQTRAGLEPAYRRLAPSSVDVKGVMKEGKEKVLRADHFACFFCDVKAVMKERKEKSGGTGMAKP